MDAKKMAYFKIKKINPNNCRGIEMITKQQGRQTHNNLYQYSEHTHHLLGAHLSLTQSKLRPACGTILLANTWTRFNDIDQHMEQNNSNKEWSNQAPAKVP